MKKVPYPLKLYRCPIMQLEAHLRLCHRCLYYKNGLRLYSLDAQHRSSGDYYDLLGVKSDASFEEIKNAFFDKSRKLHPDSDPTNPDLHGQFVTLNEAYRVLSREGSRKEYDLCLQQGYAGGRPFRQTSGYAQGQTPSADHAERMRYWEQFRYAPPQQSTADRQERRQRQNSRLVGYCMAAMFASICVHYFGFSWINLADLRTQVSDYYHDMARQMGKLEEVHNNFMDEKDRVITQIYNESKERARVNGFKKQTEIMRQKHAEFVEKYKLRGNGGDK